MMDDAEIKYLQDELIELFGRFQKVVDEFAINRIAVKRKKSAWPPEKKRDTEWFDEYWRIERSPEFLNLAGHFEYYRRLFFGENNRYLRDLFPDWATIPIAPGETYAGEDSSETWAQLVPDASNGLEQGNEGEDNAKNLSAFGLWCIMSGFYYNKIAQYDLYNWTPDFACLLGRIPTELGQTRIILAFGELPECVRFATHKLTEMDRALERTISCLKQPDFHEESFERFDMNRSEGPHWFDSHDLSVEQRLSVPPPFMCQFDSLKVERRYAGPIIERKVHISDLNNKTINPFWSSEREVFQVCCDEKCQLSFQAIVSATLLEPICLVVDLNPLAQSSLADVERSVLLDIEFEELREGAVKAGFLVDAPSTFALEISRNPRERSWLGPLFDELNSAQGRFKQLGLNRALSLFERANTVSNQIAKFILYMTVLEAVFMGGSSTCTAATVGKRYARMVADSEQDNAIYKTRLAELFARRNNIVHGNDPDLYDQPFPSFDPDYVIDGELDDFRYCSVIRNVCRRSIISFFLILARLQDDLSSKETGPLAKVLSYQGLAIPANLSQLRNCMEEVEKKHCAREFWSSLQQTLQSEVSRFGKASEIFDDKALLRGF